MVGVNMCGTVWGNTCALFSPRQCNQGHDHGVILILLKAAITALGIQPRAIIATLRPVPRPYYYKQYQDISTTSNH